MPDRFSRRAFMCKTAALTASCAFAAPAVHSRPRRTLRVLGTHVTLQEPIRMRAQQDLGIDIEFEPKGDAALLQKASTRPESFDLYEQWSNSINVLWQANAIQPIDRQRIARWSEINSLTKSGRIDPNAAIGAGDAPYKLLYVQSDGTLSSKESKDISFLPYVHNVDSFGYNAADVPRGTPYESESWAWLLDDRWRGRVALANEPTIGLFDAALAAKARGLMTFKDIGAMTKAEVDQLFNILMEYKAKGHFAGFWNSVPQSAEFMRTGRVVLESMFSPAVAMLRGQGIPCEYAAPKEGYRAWHGVMCLSSAAKGDALDAAYDYMNWWLSGWPGAFIARQGYYISNPQQSRSFLGAAEWDYWYEGRPARSEMIGPNGQVVANVGQLRNGGSYQQRLSNVAVWNTVMNTYEYSLPRWYELVTI
jgi:putative spermidine/putrescine transport system substrate-binding protein